MVKMVNFVMCVLPGFFKMSCWGTTRLHVSHHQWRWEVHSLGQKAGIFGRKYVTESHGAFPVLGKSGVKRNKLNDLTRKHQTEPEMAQGAGFLNKTGPPGKCLGVEVSFFS